MADGSRNMPTTGLKNHSGDNMPTTGLQSHAGDKMPTADNAKTVERPAQGKNSSV